MRKILLSLLLALLMPYASAGSCTAWGHFVRQTSCTFLYKIEIRLDETTDVDIYGEFNLTVDGVNYRAVAPRSTQAGTRTHTSGNRYGTVHNDTYVPGGKKFASYNIRRCDDNPPRANDLRTIRGTVFSSCAAVADCRPNDDPDDGGGGGGSCSEFPYCKHKPAEHKSKDSAVK